MTTRRWVMLPISLDFPVALRFLVMPGYEGCVINSVLSPVLARGTGLEYAHFTLWSPCAKLEIAPPS